ncbi:MAG: Hsp20/alpha crystallin family protein [bacterium]|nr:Hsp20/alpha crystallin family protein [bacterium]
MAERTIPVTTTVKTTEASTREETRQEERYLTPPVDIYETQEGLVVIADLPGVSKENADIRVDNNVLTIQGKTQHLAPGNPVYTEYTLLNFFRQFQLSEIVDQEKISADLKNGTLVIHLPKVEKAKPKRITVNVA